MKLKDLKKALPKTKEAAEGAEKLFEIAAAIGGTVATGGEPVTGTLLGKACAGAAAGALKIVDALLPGGKKRPSRKELRKVIDGVFYAYAQAGYLDQLGATLRGVKGELDKDAYATLQAELVGGSFELSAAEVRFSYGWQSGGVVTELYRCYGLHVALILRAFGLDQDRTSALVESTRKGAVERLHSYIVTSQNSFLRDYLLLNRDAEIVELLAAYLPNRGAKSDKAWQSYLRNLRSRSENPLWGEEDSGISISDLFVEPDFTYYQSSLMRAVEAVSPPRATILQFMSGLLSGRVSPTELVFIMGGPGLGKSSLVQMYASALATEEYRVILVEAQRLRPGAPLVAGIRDVLTSGGHDSVAAQVPGAKRLILIIDGFDELAHATRDTLSDLFRQAQDLVRENRATGLRILLTGRDTLFIQNDVAIPPGSHVLTLAPFGSEKVDEWSSNWNRMTKGDFEGLPYLKSSNEEITEIAGQPMLLYLLGRMHADGEAVPVETKTKGARYLLYKTILDWMCKRQEARSPDLSPGTTRRFLQLVGITTHQSGERVLHWDVLKDRLQESGLVEDKDLLEARACSAILSFALSPTREEPTSWEFTHKSFGEALAAEEVCRVLTELSRPGDELAEWAVPVPDALRRWFALFGPMPIGDDVLAYYDGWISARPLKERVELLRRVAQLYAAMLSPVATQQISAVSTTWDRPLGAVVGNATRSWFSIAGTTVGRCVRYGNGKQTLVLPDRVPRSISGASLHDGLLLAQAASPFTGRNDDLQIAFSCALVDPDKAMSLSGPARTYARELVAARSWPDASKSGGWQRRLLSISSAVAPLVTRSSLVGAASEVLGTGAAYWSHSDHVTERAQARTASQAFAALEAFLATVIASKSFVSAADAGQPKRPTRHRSAKVPEKEGHKRSSASKRESKKKARKKN